MKKTVYVIGAGASYEANLPTGDKLKKIIASLLDDKNGLNGIDSKICEALFAHMKGDVNSTVQRFIPIAKHISNGLFSSISIDNYIDEHRDNKDIELCGKLAIVRAIIEAEKDSLLYIPRQHETHSQSSGEDKSKTGIKASSLENTWYVPFFKQLTEKCTQNELKDRFGTVTLIIFNYDRCVEQFIFCALQEKYFGMTADEAASIVKCIKIHHPYGSVGLLPFYNEPGAIRFGGELFSQQLLELSGKIKTFTEGAESRQTDEIRYSIKWADRLVFLGFAFHELNMNLIKPYADELGSNPSSECFATCYKISPSDQEKICVEIKSLFGFDNIRLADMTCNDFFSHFSRSLSF